MASQPKKGPLADAKESLAAAITGLVEAADAIKVGAAPTVTTKVHIGRWRLVRDAEVKKDPEAQRRKDDMTLLADEVRDLYGRVVALEAEPRAAESGGDGGG
jgi:hypothetical protein